MSFINSSTHFKITEELRDHTEEARKKYLTFLEDELEKLEAKSFLCDEDQAKRESIYIFHDFLKNTSPEYVTKVFLVSSLLSKNGFISSINLLNLFGSNYKKVKTNIVKNDILYTFTFGTVLELRKGFRFKSASSFTVNKKEDYKKLLSSSPMDKEYYRWFKMKLLAKNTKTRSFTTLSGRQKVQESKKKRFYDFLSQLSKKERTRYTAGAYEYDINGSIYAFLDTKIKLLKSLKGKKVISKESEVSSIKSFDWNHLNLLVQLTFKLNKKEAKTSIISTINRFFSINKVSKIDKSISGSWYFNHPIYDELKSVLKHIDYRTEEFYKWESDIIAEFINFINPKEMDILHDAVYLKEDIDESVLDEFYTKTNVRMSKSDLIVDRSNVSKIKELRKQIFYCFRTLQRKNLKFETRLRNDIELHCLEHELQKLTGIESNISIRSKTSKPKKIDWAGLEEMYKDEIPQGQMI